MWTLVETLLVTSGMTVLSALLPANAVYAVFIDGVGTLKYQPSLVVYPANSVNLGGTARTVLGQPLVLFQRGGILDLRPVLGVGGLRIVVYGTVQAAFVNQPVQIWRFVP